MISKAMLMATAAMAVATSSHASAQDTDTQKKKGDDIVVTGIRANLQTSRTMKRDADTIMDVIGAEDVNQLPDDTATEAVARLPDVQVSRNRGEGQAITIRGLPQIATTLNGADTYTGISRQALLDNYPADIISSIQVYRTRTPDLIEGGMGGTVNINLRKPLDFGQGLSIAGTMRGTFDDQSRKMSYNGDILVTDRWHTPIGEIGLLVNASYQRRNYLESYRENGQRTAITAGQVATPGLASDLVYPTTLLIKHPRGYYSRPVVTTALEWKPAYNLDIGFRATLINDREVNDDDDFTTKVQGSLPTFTNVTVVPGTNVIDKATFLAAASSGPRSSYQETKAKTNQFEFSAKYLAGDATLSTTVTYTHSTEDAVQRLMLLGFRSAPTIAASFQSDTQYGGLSYGYTNADVNNLNSYYVRAYSDAVSAARSNGLQWRTDLDLRTGDGFFRSLKVGFRYANRTASYDYGSRLADLSALKLPMSAFPGGSDPETIAAGFGGDDASIPSSWIGYRGSLLGNADIYRALNTYIGTLLPTSAYATSDTPAFDPLQHFDGNEKTYAMYGQFHYGLTALGMPIEGVAGARIVNTDLTINGTQGVTTSTGTTYTPIHNHNNYINVDPSISAVLHLDKGLQLRLGWSRSFTRPDFSQLNPSNNLSQTVTNGVYAGTQSVGNPNLRPMVSMNWDASLEYYFGRVGSASLAGFIKDIDGFIVSTSTSQPSGNGTLTVTSPINSSKGLIRGVEASGSTFFDFLPGVFKRFGVSANYTYLDTHQTLPATATTPAFEGPLTKVSKHNANVQLFYQDAQFSARVAYSIRSGFTYLYNLSDHNNDLNWYPISQLDTKLTFRLARKFDITFDARNLLAKPQRASWGGREFTDRVYFEGRVFSLATRFKI